MVLSVHEQQKMRILYVLILTQTFSLIGSRISGVAVSLWLIEDQQSALPYALLILFMTLPVALMANVAGALADRWDRRYVMALSDVGQAIGTLLLLVSFTSAHFQVWHLYAIIIFQTVFVAFQWPAFGAAVTMLATDEQRVRVNAWLEIGARAAGVIAPTVGAAIYAALGVEVAIGFDLVTFVAALVVVLRVTIPHPEVSAAGKKFQGTFWQETLSGWRYLWSLRALFWFRVFVALIFFLISPIEVLLIPYLLYRTESATTVGILSSLAQGAAIVAGMLVVAWGGTRPRIHTIMPGLIACGLSFALIGMSQTPFWLAIPLAAIMLPIVATRVMLNTILQAKIPPDLQGRVFAAVQQLTLLLASAMYLLAGWFADHFFEPAVGKENWEIVAPLVGDTPGSGIGLIFVLCGAVMMLATAIVYTLPAIRHLEANLPDYTPQATRPDVQAEEITPRPAEA